MIPKDDIIGVARDHRWMRLAEQKRQLEASSRVVLTLGDSSGKNGRGQTFETLTRLVRPGTVVQLMYAFLLADPARKRQRGGLKAEFERAVSVLVDEKKAVIMDVLTGLSTETKDKRRAFTLSAFDQIRRSSQGKQSHENGKLSRGRPKRWANPEFRQIIWREWHSNAHATNTEAADEASRQMGQRITHYVMWRIVNEMREENGLKGKGASGRRPNSAAAALATAVGKPDPSRPLPKARVPKGAVYFIRNGARDRVKIGFSEGHEGRFRALQSASSDVLTLLGTVPGTMKTERRIHRKFAEYRERGEWFRVEGELARFLKTLTKTKRT